MLPLSPQHQPSTPAVGFGGVLRSSLKLSAALVVMGSAVALAMLHGCHDSPEPAAPDLATTVLQTLTVLGTGTGNGVVRSSPAGINCTITAGVAATTGCRAQFSQGIVVTLTATPVSGHSFRSWSTCSGTGSCKVTMSVNRSVTAKFLKGPFSVKVISGATGVGSGRITSQAGLTPAINCVITNGIPASTGCSAKYPAYSKIILTATPAAGFSFVKWAGPCSGSGTCQYTFIQSVTVKVTFGSSSTSTVAREGRWESPVNTPVLSIHMSYLWTNKILLWGRRGEAYLWDYAKGAAGFTQIAAPFEVFCSGHSFLPDGRLFVAGGHITDHKGLPMAAYFDPVTESWSTTAMPMAQGRWYPTTTLLPNGEMLVLAGTDENAANVPVPEVWTGTQWRRLTNAPLNLPYYPTAFVAPNGKVFVAGPQTSSYYLDPSGLGTWTKVADRHVADRSTGSAAMYAPGKILYAGGGDNPTASAEVIDLTTASPSWRTIASMTYPRRHMMATILADGKVLVTHGTSGLVNDQALAVHYPELWNPATESWTRMAYEPAIRTYHSTALLLPDARVLSSGSGEGFGVDLAHSSLTAQVFSPPYLFNPDGSLAARPAISSAPTHLGYGQSFSVQSPDAANVTRGNLIRLSADTHWFNEGQHIWPLSFTNQVGSSTLSSTSPPDANRAPPGTYMLFLLNSAGVPSIARMISIGP